MGDKNKKDGVITIISPTDLNLDDAVWIPMPKPITKIAYKYDDEVIPWLSNDDIRDMARKFSELKPSCGD